jgi:hypothetical protein
MQGPWIGRQALHAWSLQLHHPATDQAVTFRASLPEDMRQAAAALGIVLPDEVLGAAAMVEDQQLPGGLPGQPRL